MMKILIGGGGTGGHIYPALALARYVKAVDSVNEVLFIGTSKGLENRIIPAAGFPLTTIPARGFQRNFRHFVPFIADLVRGLKQSLKILKEHQPNVVLGMGGYVAAPLLISALLKKFPVVLHEQNVLPGMVNKRLAPYVKKVCLSFMETEKSLPRRSNVIFTGNPRSGEVASISRNEGCRKFDLNPEDLNILVYGGSRGALRLNQVITAFLSDGLMPEEAYLIYVTGEIYYKDVIANLGSLPARVKIYPYLDNLPYALAAANLAITRSGATTLAEITALGVPAILVPSPNVVGNHQYYNARLLSDKDAAVLIEEKDFNHIRLREEIEKLTREPGLLEIMGSNSKMLGTTDAAEKIYRCLREVASCT